MTFNQNSPAKSKKRVRGTARQRLAKACARAMRDDSNNIVDALFKRALEGNVGSVRLILSMLEKLPAQSRRKKPGVSALATAPANESPKIVEIAPGSRL